MKAIRAFFQNENGLYSSKRLVGIVGMFIIHLCYAYRVVMFGDTTDTIILVTADTALLGVEVVTKAMSHNDGTNNEGTASGSDA